MRISDWSSDVCSSDLGYAIDIHPRGKGVGTEGETGERHIPTIALPLDHHLVRVDIAGVGQHLFRRNDIVEVGVAMFVIVAVIEGDRKSVVWGKSVSVRVDLGGLRVIKKKKKKY